MPCSAPGILIRFMVRKLPIVRLSWGSRDMVCKKPPKPEPSSDFKPRKRGHEDSSPLSSCEHSPGRNRGRGRDQGQPPWWLIHKVSPIVQDGISVGRPTPPTLVTSITEGGAPPPPPPAASTSNREVVIRCRH
jgi:hypothetical protein